MTKTATAARVATSADGTEIAYEVHGTGPALVVVDGALCSRAMGPSRPLAAALADGFAVHVYDRRGRGDSGPGATPWSVEREIEDLAAVVRAAGGHAHLLGTCSGAALALEAARRGLGDGLAVGKVIGYEAPFILDDTHVPNDPDLPDRLAAMVHEGRRGDAVATFMRTVGAPGPMVMLMRLMPVWRKLTAVAHTLPYDLAIVVPFEQGRPLPEGYYDGVGVPVLMVAGGKSPAYMRNAQAMVADALPHGSLATLPGQTHMVKAGVLAPVVADFLQS